MLFGPGLINPRDCHQIHLNKKLGIPFLLLKRSDRRTNEVAMHTGFLKRFSDGRRTDGVTRSNEAFRKCPVATTGRRNEAEPRLSPLPTVRDDTRLLETRLHETTIMRNDATLLARRIRGWTGLGTVNHLSTRLNSSDIAGGGLRGLA